MIGDGYHHPHNGLAQTSASPSKFFLHFLRPRSCLDLTIATLGGGAHSMRSRSRITTDPHPYNIETGMSGFHRPGRHRMHQALNAVRCSAVLVKAELHPIKSHFVRWTSAPCAYIFAYQV